MHHSAMENRTCEYQSDDSDKNLIETNHEERA